MCVATLTIDARDSVINETTNSDGEVSYIGPGPADYSDQITKQQASSYSTYFFENVCKVRVNREIYAGYMIIHIIIMMYKCEDVRIVWLYNIN